jgi:hypothetical protein
MTIQERVTEAVGRTWTTEDRDEIIRQVKVIDDAAEALAIFASVKAEEKILRAQQVTA